MHSSRYSTPELEAEVRATRVRLQQLQASASRIGEQNTKATVIEPVLRALGWDVYDPDEVDREYRHGSQDDPVDYALRIDGKPMLFVEAKALPSQLDSSKWVKQLLSYGTVAGVEWCVLTNGDEYRIYNAHAPVEAAEKLFRCFRVSDTEKDETLFEVLGLLSKPSMAEGKLTQLWGHEFVGRTVVSTVERLVATQDKGLVNLLRRHLPPHAQKPQAIRDALRGIEVRARPVTSPAASRPPRPSRQTVTAGAQRKATTLRIGSDSYEFGIAKEILVHTANWLVHQGRLQSEHCPVAVTRGGRVGKYCLIHTEPKHPGGQPFWAPKTLENGLYIETNASRKELERYARRLLEWAGLDPELLRIE